MASGISNKDRSENYLKQNVSSNHHRKAVFALPKIVFKKLNMGLVSGDKVSLKIFMEINNSSIWGFRYRLKSADIFRHDKNKVKKKIGTIKGTEIKSILGGETKGVTLDANIETGQALTSAVGLFLDKNKAISLVIKGSYVIEFLFLPFHRTFTIKHNLSMEDLKNMPIF